VTADLRAVSDFADSAADYCARQANARSSQANEAIDAGLKDKLRNEALGWLGAAQWLRLQATAADHAAYEQNIVRPVNPGNGNVVDLKARR
jgi:hypothetical protein